MHACMHACMQSHGLAVACKVRVASASLAADGGLLKAPHSEVPHADSAAQRHGTSVYPLTCRTKQVHACTNPVPDNYYLGMAQLVRYAALVVAAWHAEACWGMRPT
jgi:hypothetical protein